MGRALKIVFFAFVAMGLLVVTSPVTASMPDAVSVDTGDVQNVVVEIPAAEPGVVPGLASRVVMNPATSRTGVGDYRGAVRALSDVLLAEPCRDPLPDRMGVVQKICDYSEVPSNDLDSSMGVMRADKKQGRPQLE
jgi:hypothetical protein